MADYEKIIGDFCEAWSSGDVDAIMAGFAENATYHNIPMDPLVGTDAIRAFIEGFIGDSGISFEIHHQAVVGNVVMNERTDTLTLNGKQVPLPVMGVFEIDDDGKISAWRDYFDMAKLMG